MKHFVLTETRNYYFEEESMEKAQKKVLNEEHRYSHKELLTEATLVCEDDGEEITIELET